MNEIENIFVRSEYQEHMRNETLQRARIKMGEVFQLPNERYALVCIHCSEEFQYFSEFTLHVNEHLKNIPVKYDQQCADEIAFVKTEIDLDDESSEMIEIISDETTETKANIENSTSIPKTETEDKKEDLTQNVPYNVDEDSCEMENDFGNDDYCVSDIDLDDSIAKESKETVMKTTELTKTTKQKTEKTPKMKKDGTPRKKYTKSVKPSQMEQTEITKKYEKLLERFSDRNEDPMNPLNFEVFKAEKVDGLFPCSIKDTPEVRLIATLSVHSYKYEKIGRDFACPICATRFPNPASVRRHLFTHVTEPVMLCGFCPEKFRAIRYLSESVI